MESETRSGELSVTSLETAEAWDAAVANFIEILDPLATSAQSFSLPSARSLKQIIRNSKQQLNFDRIRDSAGDLTPQLEQFKRRTILKIQALDKPLQSVFFHNSSVLDKQFYTFTLFNIFSMGWVLGRYPEWFHIYYSVMLLILMPVRIYTYYKTNNHYFLADLCYFVNALCILYIWALPNSVHLYQTCFAFTFGSLSFAVITWRNSFVIHSLDKVTSCFIHILPPLTMYAITHLVDEEWKLRRFPAASKQGSPNWVFSTNVFYTSIYYLIWQSLYHYFITLRKKEKIKSGQRMTSFEYLTTHKFKNCRLVKLPSPWPMLLYTLLQYLYQLSTMILCTLWFKHSMLASGFLLFVSLSASRNGAKYYIDYYGKRFETEVEKLKNQVESLTQQMNEKGFSSGATPVNSLNLETSPISSSKSGLSDEILWENKLPSEKEL